MLKLRIKIDTWTKGLNEAFREKVRKDLAEFYCQLPAHRLWIYLKRMRFMFKYGTKEGTIIDMRNEILDLGLERELLHGPEDEIAESKIFHAIK